MPICLIALNNNKVKDDLDVHRMSLDLYNDPIVYFSSDNEDLKKTYNSTVASLDGIPMPLSTGESVSHGKYLKIVFFLKFISPRSFYK